MFYFTDIHFLLDSMAHIDRVRYKLSISGQPTIITLVCSGTIDERVEQIVESKGELSDFIIDGKIKSKDRRGVLKYLLS